MKYLIEYSSYNSSFIVNLDSVELESQYDLKDNYSEVRKEAISILKKMGRKNLKIISIKKI